MKLRSMCVLIAILVSLIGVGAYMYKLYPEYVNLIPFYFMQVAYPIALVVTFLIVFVIEPYMHELRELVDEIKKSAPKRNN